MSSLQKILVGVGVLLVAIVVGVIVLQPALNFETDRTLAEDNVIISDNGNVASE